MRKWSCGSAFWQSTVYSARKYSYRNHALMYLPSRISKVTAGTQACGHFQVTYLVLLQPPLISAAGCSGRVPSYLSSLHSEFGMYSNCANTWLKFPCSVAVTEPGVMQSLL